MNDATRARLMENTARVYRENAIALRAIIPVVKKFEGKVINKRFETAMNEVKTDGIDVLYDYQFRCGDFHISVYNRNRSFTEVKDDPEAYACTCYVDNETADAWCGEKSEVFMPYEYGTANDSRLQNVALVVSKIEEKASKLERYSDDIDKAIETKETMREELQDIASRLSSFNNKYDLIVRDLLGLSYYLQYVGDSDKKDYSIKNY